MTVDLSVLSDRELIGELRNRYDYIVFAGCKHVGEGHEEGCDIGDETATMVYLGGLYSCIGILRAMEQRMLKDDVDRDGK